MVNNIKTISKLTLIENSKNEFESIKDKAMEHKYQF